MLRKIYIKTKPSVLTLVASAAVLCGIIFFSLVDPMQCNWAPKCLFKLATGYQCPGCGASRAIYALLHGHPLEALTYNYLFIVALPYLFAVIIVGWLPQSNGRWKQFILGEKLAWFYLGLFLVWWGLRNILGL